MQQNKVWGSEVEIFAISAIFEIDIYVAVECDNLKESSSYDIHQKTIRWYRYNASNTGLGFVRPKLALDGTVDKTWFKPVKTGQNWTKPKGSYKS